MRGKSAVFVRGDNELAVLTRSGDRDALGELFRRYYPTLKKICRIAGPDAEDVAADVMATLPHRLRSFNPERGAFRVWVAVVGRNAAVRHVGKDRCVLTDDDRWFERGSQGDDPEVRVVEGDLLVRFMAALNDRDADVVLACSFGAETDAEIADRLDLSEITVRRIRHGCRRLLGAMITRDVMFAPQFDSCADSA